MAISIDESKYERIQLYVKQLCGSVPGTIREEVYTEMLLKGLTLVGFNNAYIYASLRNKKYDLLRGPLGRCIHTRAVEWVSGRHETPRLDEELDYTGEFGVLYLTYTYLTGVQRKFFRDIVRHIRLGKRWDVKKSSKRCRFSIKRGYLIYSQIKETYWTARRAVHIGRPDHIETFGQLYEAILRWK